LQGETVVDLGSGGGIDVLLAARKVCPKGKAIGVDMTKVRNWCSNAIFSNLGPPWDLSYQEDRFELQKDLSDPESAIIRDEKSIKFKTQRESQIPETFTPADSLVHTSTTTDEYSSLGYGTDFLNE
jgi:hypothetical protein